MPGVAEGYTLIMAFHNKQWCASAGLLLVFLLAGCSSNIPDRIRLSPAYDLKVKQVQASPKRYLDERIRWGGEIISVENKKSDTWFEVLSRPLDSEGQPRWRAESEGRFLARMSGFLDPAVYAPGRELTVSGWLGSTTIRNVGEYPYRFPLVNVEEHYLWPLRMDARNPWHGDSLAYVVA